MRTHLLLAALLTVLPARAAESFDTKPWLEDYQQLRAHVARVYANLDDAAARGMDLPKLDRETTAALRRARSETEAMRVLLAFVGAFQDGHFQFDFNSHPFFHSGPRYNVRLTVQDGCVVMGAPPPAPCALKPGDAVERVNGRAMKDLLAELEPLAGVRNAKVRRDIAASFLARGPFAPSKELLLEGRSSEGERVTCRFEPDTTPAPAPAAPSSAPAPVTFSLTGDAACAALGFKAKPAGSPFEGPEVPGFERLTDASNAFPAGLLTLAPERKLGVVRIPLFSEEAYPSACIAAWGTYRAGREGTCDDACQQAFRGEVVTRLLADLAARVKQFQRAKVEGVVVDLTGNGGGTNWVDPAMRIFGPKGMACPGQGVIRHPHHVKIFEDTRAELDADLAKPELPEADRRLLSDARERVAKWMEAAKPTCSRDAVWTKPGATVACPNVLRTWGACGLVAYLPQGALPGVASRTSVFEALGYRYEEGLYTGPVTVLMNSSTASAAEYAAGMLKDSAGARLVGSPTYGSGCGYINGGVPLVLAHSGLRVRMPDCARYRKDGTNEVAGLVPDVAVSWSPLETPEARAAKWMDVLRASLKAP